MVADVPKKIGMMMVHEKDNRHGEFGFPLRYANLNETAKKFNLELLPVRAFTMIELKENVETVLRGEIDLHGLIFCTYTPALKPVVDMLNEGGLPYLFTDMPRAEPGVNGVYIDQFEAARLSTKRLIETGHERIAWIGVMNDSDWFEQRHDGYLKALKDAGIKRSGELIFRLSDPGEEGGCMVVKKLIVSGEMPGAFFCASLRIAKGVIKTLLEEGIKIPQEAAVTAVDDPVNPKFCEVALTTVKFDLQSIPFLAFKAISKMKRMKSPETLHIQVAQRLIIRDSA